MQAVSASEAATRPLCDHRSVGIDVVSPTGAHLMLRHVKPPTRIVAPGGHVDDNGSPEDVARAEIVDRLGLTITRFELVTGGWLPNRCGRAVVPGRDVGHLWTIFRAKVTWHLDPRADEAGDFVWRSSRQVQTLANRTVDYARGEITDRDFTRAPSLEPAWVYWYARLGVIQIIDDDLKCVGALDISPKDPPGSRPHMAGDPAH